VEGGRRMFFQKSLLGTAAVVSSAGGIVINGVSVQGPPPYFPKAGSLSGKLIVITGGNTGLGLESGKRLAAAGATVVLACRNEVKGMKAVESIKSYVLEHTGQVIENVYALPLDLCDLESIKTFPQLLKNCSGFQKIDVLVNNAGVMAVPDLQITKDGFEKTFQSNHLGHFALTALLEPMFNPQGCRVVNVSSMAYLIASKGLDMQNLNGKVEYKPWDAYGTSKLANILFTKELQKRADASASGKKITAVALHPGAVRTDLPRYIIGEDKFVPMQDSSKLSAIDIIKLLPLFYFTKSVERGANTQVYLSAFQGGDDIGGKFFFNMKETKLLPAALDMDKAQELWQTSEDMIGFKFELLKAKDLQYYISLLSLDHLQSLL
jgi:Dehydrogenases with different specificities (related to short-chain alcohol dehydrogenases)